MARTDNDSWDLASSVGATATMVALGRALSSREPDALIDDPFAEPLVRAVGIEFFTKVLDGDIDPDAFPNASPERARAMIDGMAVRTKFFDDYCTAAADAGIRQVVILASGLDSRAYRLDWPAGTRIFEIDQPKVLEYKAAVLDRHGVRPAAELTPVPIDLRADWPAALRAAGFDPELRSAWLAEGLLMYLPSEAQDRLFENIGELCAPGSRVAAETAVNRSEERRAELRERLERATAILGLEPGIDVGELIYHDPQRTELVGWLGDHGWRATGVRANREMARLGRGVAGPTVDDESFSFLVTAQRR